MKKYGIKKILKKFLEFYEKKIIFVLLAVLFFLQFSVRLIVFE